MICLADVYAIRVLFNFFEQPSLREDNLDLSLPLSLPLPTWRRSAGRQRSSSTLITHSSPVLLIFLNIFVLSQLVRNYQSIDHLWSTHTT